jgi:hypothetical protein
MHLRGQEQGGERGAVRPPADAARGLPLPAPPLPSLQWARRGEAGLEADKNGSVGGRDALRGVRGHGKDGARYLFSLDEEEERAMSWTFAFIVYGISVLAWLWLDYQLIREAYRWQRPVREAVLMWEG